METRAKYTADELKNMVAKGHAIKNAKGDPSYPIADAEDLGKAIRAVGRGGSDHDAIRRHIIKRAKALGLSSEIPDDWSADGSIGESKAAARLLELRKRRRNSMTGMRERRALPFTQGNIELRAKPSGHGTTNFEFNGYAVAYMTPFEMWDQWGEPYEENVRRAACAASLARNPDLPFLIGHNDSGISLARTKSGTMRLFDDSKGLGVNVPELDGRSPQVQSLASAIERGDMDEMSVGFICNRQSWSPDYGQRDVIEMDLHRGDVSIVCLAANPATSGATLTVPGMEAASQRRPGAQTRMPTAPYAAHAGEGTACPQCQSLNDADASFCDQCGARMPGVPGESTVTGEDESQQCQSCLCMNATDAKFCDQCGSGLAGVRPWRTAGGGYSDWAAGRRGERRAQDEIMDMSGAPDYNPAPHEDDPGAIRHVSGCAVEGGALNSPDAKFCDQDGGALYDSDGLIVLDDSGAVEEIEGAAGGASLRSADAPLEEMAMRLRLLEIA